MNNDARRQQTRLLEDATGYLAPLDAGDVASANANVSVAGRVNV